jgi:hypothetical protein
MKVDGVDFACLEDARKWKAASGRPKGMKGPGLIARYLER